MLEKKIVIIGGGLQGVFVALFLDKYTDYNITLIEKQKQLGGLLRSVPMNQTDESFDIGAHYLLLSKSSLDTYNIMTSCIDKNQWHVFNQSLPAGSFMNQIDETSECLNVKQLLQSHDEYITAITEIFNNLDQSADSNGLLDYFYNHIGKETFKHTFKPIIDKYYGHIECLNDYSRDSSSYFFPNRYRLFSEDETILLKKDERLNKRLAYFNQSQVESYQSDILKLYPKKGAIGQWFFQAKKYLESRGHEFLLETDIEEIKRLSQNKYELTIHSNQSKFTRNYAYCVNTLPSFVINRIKNNFITSIIHHKTSNIRFSGLCVVMLLLDAELVPQKIHWVTNYNSEYQFFRVNLYNNIQNISSYTKISVEFAVGDNSFNTDEAYYDLSIQELKRTGILKGDINVIDKQIVYYPNAYVFTPKDQEKFKIEYQASDFIHLKPANQPFGQLAILETTYQHLHQNFIKCTK